MCLTPSDFNAWIFAREFTRCGGIACPGPCLLRNATRFPASVPIIFLSSLAVWRVRINFGMSLRSAGRKRPSLLWFQFSSIVCIRFVRKQRIYAFAARMTYASSRQTLQTVWMEGSACQNINQLLLPHKFEIASLPTHKYTAAAIKDMTVRAQAQSAFLQDMQWLRHLLKSNNPKYLEEAKKHIESTRQLAQNLFYATNRVFNAAVNASKNSGNSKSPKETAILERKNRRRRRWKLQKKSANWKRINQGWRENRDALQRRMARVLRLGSALSQYILQSGRAKKCLYMWTKTRPRLQGMLLTSWELGNEQIEHKIIPDNAGAFYMSQGIDLMIVGADRIAANGDTANKIGTFEKQLWRRIRRSVLTIAAPTTTFDLKCKSGKTFR